MLKLDRTSAAIGAGVTGMVWLLTVLGKRNEPSRDRAASIRGMTGTPALQGSRPGSPAASDRSTALAALYQGDRGDAASSLNAVLALLAAVIAYITATIAFSADIDEKLHGASILVPLPVYFIVAFQSLLVATSMIRAASLSKLEVELLQIAVPDSTKTQMKRIGIRSYERVMNVAHPEGSLFHKAANVVAYGGIFVAIMAYTAYFVHDSTACPTVKIVMSGVYLILITVWLGSIVKGVKISKSTLSELGVTPGRPVSHMREN